MTDQHDPTRNRVNGDGYPEPPTENGNGPVADLSASSVVGGADDGADQDPPPRDFPEWLLKHTRGRTADDIAKRFREVGAAVKLTEKAGKVVVTFKLEPVKDVPGMVKVSDTVKAEVPELPRPASSFFVDQRGDLRDEDPTQRMFSGMPRR